MSFFPLRRRLKWLVLVRNAWQLRHGADDLKMDGWKTSFLLGGPVFRGVGC